MHCRSLRARLAYVTPVPRRVHPRPFHSTAPSRLFGLSLPVPSNDPLAGTTPDAAGPPILFILQVIVGLPAVLWAYKCLMLVAFQRKIIYLPSVPPGTRDESLARQERTAARDASLSNLDWQEVEVKSEAKSRVLRRNVVLKGVELRWRNGTPLGDEDAKETRTGQARRKVVVVYLQGNAGTPLMRIPLFRQLLRPGAQSSRSRPLSNQSGPGDKDVDIMVIAVAPRSFWQSTRTTPTEASVVTDYLSVLRDASRRHGPDAKYVLYGHSLGGAAVVLLLERLRQPPFRSRATDISRPASRSASAPAVDDRLEPPVSGVILENPLPSIPYMVRALYPQKWLPYHYLGPFAFDRWDAIGRLATLARERRDGRSLHEVEGTREMPSLWLRSERDEIIPTDVGQDGVRTMFRDWCDALEGEDRSSASLASRQDDGDDGPGDVRKELTVGLQARWVDVRTALHDMAYTEREWRDAVRRFLDDVARSD
ncbi:hypothetical protein JCM10212_005638 [Sporobolomyces blumeae]